MYKWTEHLMYGFAHEHMIDHFTSAASHFFNFLKRFYLFIFRDKGGEGETEGQNH